MVHEWLTAHHSTLTTTTMSKVFSKFFPHHHWATLTLLCTMYDVVINPAYILWLLFFLAHIAFQHPMGSQVRNANFCHNKKKKRSELLQINLSIEHLSPKQRYRLHCFLIKFFSEFSPTINRNMTFAHFSVFLIKCYVNHFIASLHLKHFITWTVWPCSFVFCVCLYINLIIYWSHCHIQLSASLNFCLFLLLHICHYNVTEVIHFFPFIFSFFVINLKLFSIRSPATHFQWDAI